MKIIAHRGARAEEPENTLRAIKRALECSADAVEIDIRLSKKDTKILGLLSEDVPPTFLGNQRGVFPL